MIMYIAFRALPPHSTCYLNLYCVYTIYHNVYLLRCRYGYTHVCVCQYLFFWVHELLYACA